MLDAVAMSSETKAIVMGVTITVISMVIYHQFVAQLFEDKSE
jgi:hypothetical protein